MGHLKEFPPSDRSRPELSKKPDEVHFHLAPVSIWEEDFSEVKAYIDKLKNKGIKDLRDHFESHPEDVLFLARKVKIDAVNRATLSLYGARNEEELFQGLNTVFNKESYDVFREELIALSQGKTEFQSEAANITLTGEEKHILIKVVVPPGHEKTLSRLFVYITDISDLKRREAQLMESAEKYRKIVETAHDAILMADTETGIVIEANEKAEELLGIPVREIIGMHFTEFHPLEEAAHPSGSERTRWMGKYFRLTRYRPSMRTILMTLTLPMTQQDRMSGT